MKRMEKAPRALPLDEACAFSVLTHERKTLDFVAPSAPARTMWLRDLRTLLLYGHYLDHAKAREAVEAGVRRGSLNEVHAVQCARVQRASLALTQPLVAAAAA